jgi:type VI secretion system protein ImpA
MSNEVQVIPIDSLLAPMESGNPSGANLRYSDLFDQIREARRSEYCDDMGVWTRPQKVPDWAQVVSLASDALQKRTKDLFIMCWLTEALAKTQGFPGIRDGLKLLRLSIDRFWDTLYPEIDDGDLEARGNALVILDRELDSTARELPLTDSPSGTKYGYNQWLESMRYKVPHHSEDAQSLRQYAAAENKVTSEQWDAALHVTPAGFYDLLKVMVQECWDEFRLFQCAVDGRFGFQAPNLAATRRALKGIGQMLDETGRIRLRLGGEGG